MKITKFEQSGFILESESGFKLAIDIGSYTPLGSLNSVGQVDAMLVSHIHGDHFSIDQIKKLSPKKLFLNEECINNLDNIDVSSEIIKVKVGDKVDINGIKVEFFDVDHGPNVKIRPKENFGFLIHIDGLNVYFAGDMFYKSGINVSNLDVDLALIPIGTFYTFGPNEAIDFMKNFKSIGEVIPMHYEKSPETKDEFLSLSAKYGFIVRNA